MNSPNAQSGMAHVTSILPITDLAALELQWRGLALKSDANTSFFLQWPWMGSWLSALQATDMEWPDIFSVQDDAGNDIALALIGRAKDRRKLGRVPAFWLNQCGHGRGDRPFIEYNGLLTRAGEEGTAISAFIGAMAECRDWRALYLSGMEEEAAIANIPRVRRRLIDASPTYYVDLDAVRDAGGDYLSLISANSRQQINRSIRALADAPSLIPVLGEGDLLEALDEMARLNAGRHQDEAWDDAFFRDFAVRLVMTGAQDGSVEIMRVAAGTRDIGYLLNFIRAGRVMNYQSAFVRPSGPHDRPGLMAHHAAAEYYAVRRFSCYSFLAGKDRYKKSLSTNYETLCWWVLERHDWRLDGEAILRRLLRR